MRFKQLSARVLEPTSMWIMIAGIVALCQPWVLYLHRYGVTVIIVGLVGFIIFSHIRPDDGLDPTLKLKPESERTAPTEGQ
jgi:hypothetical protein